MTMKKYQKLILESEMAKISLLRIIAINTSPNMTMKPHNIKESIEEALEVATAIHDEIKEV